MRGLSDLGKPDYKLSPEEVRLLRELVIKSNAELQSASSQSREIIKNLWNGLPAEIDLQGAFLGISTSSDASSTGDVYNSMQKNIKDVAAQKGSPVPRFSANILQVGTRILATSILPSAPTLHTVAQREGVQPLIINQNYIFRLIAEHGGLLTAFRNAIYTGLLDTHFGLLVTACKDEATPAERIRIEDISAEDCGQEPELKRVKWVKQRAQFKDLGPEVIRRVRGSINALAASGAGSPEKIADSDIVTVWSIWHGGLALNKEYGEHPLTVLLDTPAGAGIYVGTWKDDACRIVIRSMLRPAPGSYVPHSEAHSWLSPIQMSSELLYSLNTEVSTMTRYRLHDKEAIPIEAIEDASQNTRNGISWIAVDVKPGDPNGVGQKARPMEQDSNLSAILASYNLVWRIASYVMGISDIDFGDAPSPRKSATEAQNIDAHLSQRRKERLEIVADAMKEVGFIVMRVQRRALGKTFMAEDGTLYEVPTYKRGAMSVRIDPVEMGHLNLREEVGSILSLVQLLGNLRSVFPAGLPAEVRGPLAKVATIMGEHDLAATLSLAEMNDTPRDRIVDMMATNGTSLVVKEEDDPAMFTPYYRSLLGRLTASGKLKFAGVITQALQTYDLMARERAAQASMANGPAGPAAPQPQQIPFPQQFRQV